MYQLFCRPVAEQVPDSASVAQVVVGSLAQGIDLLVHMHGVVEDDTQVSGCWCSNHTAIPDEKWCGLRRQLLGPVGDEDSLCLPVTEHQFVRSHPRSYLCYADFHPLHSTVHTIWVEWDVRPSLTRTRRRMRTDKLFSCSLVSPHRYIGGPCLCSRNVHTTRALTSHINKALIGWEIYRIGLDLKICSAWRFHRDRENRFGISFSFLVWWDQDYLNHSGPISWPILVLVLGLVRPGLKAVYHWRIDSEWDHVYALCKWPILQYCMQTAWSPEDPRLAKSHVFPFPVVWDLPTIPFQRHQ